MKALIGKSLFLTAILLSLVAVQPAHSQELVTVTGVVYSVSVADSVVQVDEGGGTITTVNCVPLTRLANKYKVVLEVGDNVSFEAYERTFSDGTTKLVATELTAENESGLEVTITLR